jgi:hypothetical protein
MNTLTLMQTALYIFASLCIAAVLIMVALWLFYKLDEAVDDYHWRRERRKEMKKQEIK